jgi:Ca2+-binding RTX toxin-like protein
VKRFGILAAVAALLMSAGIAAADSQTIDFEPPAYTPGTIDGQEGWGGSDPGTGPAPILPAIDQAIVTNGPSAPASFGAQSWRFSNAWEDGQFGLWPFSPSLANEAGEFAAENDGMSGGTRQTRFEVEWDFASATPASAQPTLQMSTAPDRGDGARMSYIRMEDHVDGMYVYFVDYQRGTAGLCDGAFPETIVGSGLSRAVAHTVRLTIDFVDGPTNDVVQVYVDGSLRHTGTSWEDYFRDCEGNPTRTVDSMIFQSRGVTPNPENAGKGFLIDNLSYASSLPLTCNVIVGTAGPDTLNGTNKSDCIDGRGGNDTINGGNGKDVLLGGDGDDTISGGNGGDYIFGGDGNDTMYGNNASDNMDGEDGIDQLDGGRGNDTCLGEILLNCES